jgi:hypothetical protein
MHAVKNLQDGDLDQILPMLPRNKICSTIAASLRPPLRLQSASRRVGAQNILNVVANDRVRLN